MAHPVHLPSAVSRTYQRWFCPQAFDSLQSLVSVCPTVQFHYLKYWFLWYLLLEVFTRTSFPVQNPITSVFKVRCPLGDWVFKVVEYPAHLWLGYHNKGYPKNKKSPLSFQGLSKLARCSGSLGILAECNWRDRNSEPRIYRALLA